VKNSGVPVEIRYSRYGAMQLLRSRVAWTLARCSQSDHTHAYLVGIATLRAAAMRRTELRLKRKVSLQVYPISLCWWQ
jgi:hypothetical protein